MADVESVPVGAVNAERLMAHCAEFARHVKLSGSAEERASLLYVQRQMDEAGFRTELILHDAYISLPGPASVSVDGDALTAITHSFSRPSPPGGLSAPLIDLGGGTEADFAGVDARGAIVLVDGIASPAVAARAARAGAAGQLHVSPHEHLHEMCISPVWGSPGPSTLAELPRTVACTVSAADGAALRLRLAAGTPAVTLHAEVDTGWRKTPILQADMDAPAGPDAPFILFTGHHDTWYFGVMDNGSANATMMEAARALAATRATWRRGLRLCFWSGHSHGRYSGSAWYVDTHWAELETRCAVHVNVDSTGAIGASVMTESATATELAAVAADALRAELDEAHEGRRMSRNSDMSFWGIGIPSLFGSLSHQAPGPVAMRNPLGWWWHTPHDLLDKIDPDNLRRDTRIFVRAIHRLLTDPVLPLDIGAQAGSLLVLLRELEPRLAGRLDVSPLIRAAETVREAAPACTRDLGLMRACRALVPLDYTEGDRFRHDPALPQPPWPALEPLRVLAAAAEGDEALFAAVDARRAASRLHFGLIQATRALHS